MLVDLDSATTGPAPFRGTSHAVADGSVPVPMADSYPSGHTNHPIEVHGQQGQTVRISHLRVLPSLPAMPRRRELRPLGAVLFLPPGIADAAHWTEVCGDYIQRCGYRLAAVCATWPDAIRLVTSGEADVIVAGRRDHLSPDRTPRLEVMTEEKPQTPLARRRPRRL